MWIELEVHMKKKKLIVMMIAVILFASLAGCITKGTKGYEKNTGLVAIPNSSDLYYDNQTKIVYFVFNEYSGYQGYGYMSAYYAPNGLPYLYDPFIQELVKINCLLVEPIEDTQLAQFS